MWMMQFASMSWMMQKPLESPLQLCAYAKPVGDGVEAVSDGGLPYSDGDMVLWNQGWLYVDVLMLNIGSQLDNDVCESGLTHIEVLQPPLVVSGTQACKWVTLHMVRATSGRFLHPEELLSQSTPILLWHQIQDKRSPLSVFCVASRVTGTGIAHSWTTVMSSPGSLQSK